MTLILKKYKKVTIIFIVTPILLHVFYSSKKIYKVVRGKICICVLLTLSLQAIYPFTKTVEYTEKRILHIGKMKKCFTSDIFGA